MSSRWFRLLVLTMGPTIFLGVITVVFNSIFSQGFGITQSDQIKLFAFSTKAIYAKGEPISILVALKNMSKSALGLSDQVAGTLQIIALKKDGQNVLTRTSFVSSYESLVYLLKQSVKSVIPGESLPLLLTSESDPELGGEALGAIQLEQQGLNQVTYYAVTEPGRYELSLVYEIPALPGLAPGAFKGKTNEATVSFTLTR